MMTTKTRELLLLYKMSSATIDFLYILAMFSTTCYLCGIDKNLLIKINGDSIMNSV